MMMAAEGSSSRSSSGSSAADSYIGSLISLTSKSEIRYEGVLYNINTDESSIGLRNVRSYGTEGRKKDGLQVPPGDKVYEYILFRGSDIKDLQVKSPPTAQPSPPANNDSTIIQSQHSSPVPASTSLPAAVSSTVADSTTQTPHMGLPGSNVQGGFPQYQPGGTVGLWGLSPPSSNGSGHGMPMYWPGYYAPPNGVPSHMYQQQLMRPSGLSVPPLSQHMTPPLQEMPSMQQKLMAPLLLLQPHQMPSALQEQPLPSFLQQQQQPSSLQQQQLPSFQQQQLPSFQQQQLPSIQQQQLLPSFEQQQISSFQQQQLPSLQQQQLSSLQRQQLPSLQQQLLASIPLQMSSSIQQQIPPFLHQAAQYPIVSAPLPVGSSSLPAAPLLFPSGTGTGNSTSISSSTAAFSSSLPVTLPPFPVTSLAVDGVFSCSPSKAPIAAPLVSNRTPITSLSSATSLITSGSDGNAVLQPVPSKPTASNQAALPHQDIPQAVASKIGTANPGSTQAQAQAPALITPGQLLKPISNSSIPSPQTAHKDVEVVEVSSSPAPEPLTSTETKVKPPILPLPTSARPVYKPNGAPSHPHHGYRGRGRGRGRMNSRPLTTFSEEFDFTAMNEKFNKDEVWGHLGKSKSHDQEEDGKFGDEDFSHCEELDLPKLDVKPVYNKDDFFDSLSSNTQDQESNHGRHRFSEQRKIDTETFGEFARYRGGWRGGRGPSRGSGGRYQSSYHGRDYGRGGYGYGRGRGRGGPN